MLLDAKMRWSTICRIASRQEGSTSVEYAVLFGVVTLSLIVGVVCLGQISQSSLQATANAMDTLGSRDTSSLAQGNAHGTSQNPETPNTDSAQQAGISRWQIIALGIAFFVACGAPLSYVVIRPLIRKKALPDETEASEPAKPAPTFEDQAFEKRNKIRNAFANNMASLLGGRLKVRHVMSRQLTCVRKSASAETVREMMETKQVRHVMVTDPDGKLLGIISHQDCAERSGKRAGDIMTTEPFSIDIDFDLSPAVTMLIRRRISCVPVTSDGNLAGVVTTTDFLMALQCALQTLGNVAEHLPPPEEPRRPRPEEPTHVATRLPVTSNTPASPDEMLVPAG